jgi:Ca-activated chloride channel family protein
MEFRFEQPWLLLLLVLPVAVALLRLRRGGGAWPGTTLAAALPASRGPLAWHLLMAAALACLVVAAARPQHGRTVVERSQSGRDLMLVIDLSGSMQVDDLAHEGKRSDRLAAVVRAAAAFVARRPDDRIGLTFFSTRAVTACPPTFDHQTVLQFLERMERQQRAVWDRGDERGTLGGQTNLGLGVAMAARALRDRGAPGRAVVLITDGADSRDIPGWVDPLQAARSALAAGVRVHGIGVGDPEGTMSRRGAFGQIQLARVPRQLLPDMGRLRAVAVAGGGESFAAADAEGLEQVFTEIDRLEPSRAVVTESDDVTDRWRWPLAAGVALLLLALLLEPRMRGTP